MLSTPSSPLVSSSISTSDQWAAILHYDASRRQSTGTNDAGPTKARRHSDQASTSAPSLPPKRLSRGNDLPHMPIELQAVHPRLPVRPRGSLGSSTLFPLDDLGKASPSSDNCTIQRPVTPPALKGDNAILVDRELDRLRHCHIKTLQRHWRIYTGAAMLIVLGLCAFILTKYILAYLVLSPPGWLLSDAAKSSQSSPDPLLRTLAFVAVCASAVALLGVLSSGFYLRFSRRRSCGSAFVWIAAIASTIISILLSVVNLALIAILHRKYASSTDLYAATRDVSRRCSGSWALDILWQAAESSPQAENKTGKMSSCQHDATRTLQEYLSAGGIRLIVMVAFCALWLFCLSRYNRSLRPADGPSETIEESAEMHRLLMEVEEGKDADKLHTEGEPYVPGAYGEKDTSHGEEYIDEGPRAPPPRLNRFRWQKEASTVDEAQAHANTQGQHGKEPSAGAWSVSVIGQLWSALWGTNEASDHHQVASDDMEDDFLTPMHERQSTRLGVRGWFLRDPSGQASEDNGVLPAYNEDVPSRHLTPSQMKRAREGRHAAARFAKIREEESSIEARDRGERQRIAQMQRIEFLSNLAAEGQRKGSTESDKNHCPRRSSQSAGDDLPHMPEMKNPTTHLYAQTMGKLIRKLSAIESEGSQEWADRAGRSCASGSALY